MHADTDNTPAYKIRARNQAQLCLLGITSEVIFDDVGNETYVLTRGHVTVQASPGEVLAFLESKEAQHA
jgi:hypothetical protein